MKLASLDRSGFWETQSFRAFRLYKRAYQFLRYRPGTPKLVLAVAGCQRSGTSMIQHVLRRDRDCVTYDEISPLSSDDALQGLRLNALGKVQARVMADRAPFVVLKPLVDSQNLPDILDLFPEARALWMYRHYADVAFSNVRYFGQDTGSDDLSPLLNRDFGSWKAQKMAAADLDLIARLYRPGMGALDAAALFWYARNCHFFAQGIAADARVRACRYSDLVTRPHEIVPKVYDFIGRAYPGDGILVDVTSGSVGRGRVEDFSPGVKAACDEMLHRLDSSARIS